MTLAARNLDFGYPGHPIGRNVSLSVGGGEVVCLLGPNGGGKTTLFKTLLGLLAPQGGEVLLDDAVLSGLQRRKIAQRVSYVPQAHEGFFPFTVRDVALMGRTAHLGPFGGPGAADLAHVEQALACVGIAHLADEVYTRISGGERQLALIARALTQDAAYMVLDEPTANLDFGNQVRVLEQIRAAAAAGVGILLSTHDPDHAFLCADRVALLADGALVAEGEPPDVITPDNLRRLYRVEVQVEMLSGGRRTCVPRLGGV
jgi:iron complex transport system ATP-binding protein